MAIKVLLVLDGGYRFDDPPAPEPDLTNEQDFQDDFTYTALVGALTDGGIEVTKAHRDFDATADHQDFNFATTLDLMAFDVIWMIGHRGRNLGDPVQTKLLSPTELEAITRFMNAGGGVFATGDHDSIGSEMCGKIPRVRAMRSWYGRDDAQAPFPGIIPDNFPPYGTSVGDDFYSRADTTLKNPLGQYPPKGVDDYVWFENQSDSLPQAITPTTSPAHPILRKDGADITVYPDHMHEGNTLGEVPGYDYTQMVPIGGGGSVAEFPIVSGIRPMPQIIATGQTNGLSSGYAEFDTIIDESPANLPEGINTLSVYDGREAGIGRVVTGATFHHYIDINLTGDIDVTGAVADRTGPDAAKGEGFGYAGA